MVLFWETYFTLAVDKDTIRLDESASFCIESTITTCLYSFLSFGRVAYCFSASYYVFLYTITVNGALQYKKVCV